MTIIRSKDIQNYITIDTKIFEMGLSLGAIGVYMFILAQDKDSEIDYDYIMDNSKHGENPEDVIDYILELSNAGLIEREVDHD